MTVQADVVEVDNTNTLHQSIYTTGLSKSELHLWRRQAQAIGRSLKHLQSIDRLLQLVQENQRLHDSFVTSKNEHQVLDVSKRTYQVRLQDNEEFIEQAFVLFRGQQQQQPLTMPKTYIKQHLSIQKLNSWWLRLKNHLQRLKTQLHESSRKIAARIYDLLK